MLISLLTFPAFDPVAFTIGPFAIRWYALAYVTGILVGWWYIGWLNKTSLPKEQETLTKQAYDNIVVWLVLSIMLGGRLGYVVFYNPSHYASHPLEILYVWQGGMSFHGGLLGVIIGQILFCRKYELRFLAVMDLLACAAPIGLMLGRIANFINGELYGRVTDSPWGMVFPRGGELFRHPSQLYEAGLEGVTLFIMLLLLVRFTSARAKLGLLSGVFLAFYALSRMAIEQFREPDEQLGFLFSSLTMGQLLSAPMLAFGLYLIFRKARPA